MADALATLDALLQSATAAPKLYPPNSRYYNQPTLTYTGPDGTPFAYLSQRFVPQPDTLSLVRTHSVAQGDRIDNIAANSFSDPQLYWRICDANNAMRPSELTRTLGRLLRLTLPQGVPGGMGGG
jgi:hypothetical protein